MAILNIECPYCKQEHEEDITMSDISDGEPAPGDDERGKFVCKYPTDSGPCSREVNERMTRCWQHQDNENG